MDNELENTDTPSAGRHGGKDFGHVPVLLQEAIDFLAVKRGGTYLDATVGLGGHSLEIAKRLGARGLLMGVDKDPAALEVGSRGLAPVVSRQSSVVSEQTEPPTTNGH